MSITLHDRAPLEKVRRLADGRIAAVAKFARSGCYQYSGAEVGRPDLASVTVYRPESEVFDQAAMASFAHKAITIDHPAGSVTADNWKTHSVGWTEGKVARDGEYVEIPLMLADASAVRAYDAGKRELSAGYTCDLTWGDGIAPDGTRYQATMRTLRGNHIAIVGAGRAGSECRIGDAAKGPASIDERVKREVRELAKLYKKSPSEWLAGQSNSDLEDFITGIVKRMFAEAEAQGVSEMFKLDSSRTVGQIIDAVKADPQFADVSVTDAAAIDLEVARMRNDHRTKFAWMGDQAPTFNEANARAVATSKVQNDWARQTRDAAYADTHIAEARAVYDAAQARRSDERTNAWRGGNADVRNLARDSQY